MRTAMLLLVLMTCGMASAQKFTTAIDYNDHIVDLQNEIVYKMTDFNMHMGDENATMESIQPYFDDLLNTTRDVVKRMKKVEVWDGNEEMKASAMALFRFYEVTIDEDYRQMLAILYQDELTDEDYNKITEILEKVTASENLVDERFQAAQEALATKYDFSLDENELQEVIDGE